MRLRPPRDPAGALLWRTGAQLAITTLILVTALVVIIGLTTAVVATTLMRGSIDHALEAAASDPLTLHELMEDEEQYEYAGPFVKADTFVILVDEDGSIYGSTIDARVDGLPDMDAVAAAAHGPDRRSGRYGELDLRLLTRDMGDVEIEDDLGTTALFLQAGHDLSLGRELERQLLTAIVLIGMLGIVGPVLVTLVVTRRALVPIREAFETERRFVAAASHELRTPVAVIRASAEIIAREGLAVHEGRPFFDDIVGETERMGRLVDDLMTLASTRADALPVERRKVDALAYFGEIARRAGSLAEARGIRPSISVPDAPVGAFVLADPDRLDQLVLILVDNAIKSSPPKGELRLALSIETPGRHAIISVSDDGPGIDRAEIERIFEPFERGRRERNSVKGAGLGLTIARQLAADHDARLEVRSDGGAGATFELVLPLTDPPAS